jgi:hypothetical protein
MYHKISRMIREACKNIYVSGCALKPKNQSYDEFILDDVLATIDHLLNSLINVKVI